MKTFSTYNAPLSGCPGVAAALLLLVASPVFGAQETKPAPKPALPATPKPGKAATQAAGKAKPPTGTAGSGAGRGGAEGSSNGRGGGATANANGSGAGRGGGASTANTAIAVNDGRKLGTPPRVKIEQAKNGGVVQRREDGRLREVRTPNGAVIDHGLAGNRRVEMERPDHSRVVAERGGHGYVQRPYIYGGHEFAHRTYYDHGKVYDRFYGRYEYRPGVFVEVYSPVRYYPAGYYGWVANPWAAPVVYPWGWTVAANPWYGYYGYYFSPAPVYPTASLWLTDYLISQSLQDAYQAQLDAAAQMQAANAAQAAAITPEVKGLIAEEVQRQMLRENAEALAIAQNADFDPKLSGIWRLLNDRESHIFVVGSDLDLVDGTGLECAVSEGDVLQLNSPPAPAADAANLIVLASKGGAECRKRAQVSVAFPDLQNLQNHMRETIDQGLGDLQTRQGQGGLPTAPIAARGLPVQTSFAAIAPPPDPNAATQINQQSQEAELGGTGDSE